MLLHGLNGLLGIISLGVLCLHVFALVDAAIRPAQVFPAAEKQTKQFWLIILGLATAWQLFFGLFNGLFIGIIGIIAVIVYIVDVRPAVRSLGRGGGRSQGPYGPW